MEGTLVSDRTSLPMNFSASAIGIERPTGRHQEKRSPSHTVSSTFWFVKDIQGTDKTVSQGGGVTHTLHLVTPL